MKACIRLVGVVIVATALVIMWSGYVYAGVITIHFPTDLADTGCCINHNSTADGFRISPRFHYDSNVLTNASPFFVPAIGWDESGGLNPQYLGPLTVPGCPFPFPFSCPINLYVDDNGRPFDLLSLEALGSEDYAAFSSKGGVVSIPMLHISNPPPLHVDFTGPEWRGIQWVVFSGDGGAPSQGFNQLVVFVPAPSTFALLGLGVLILGWRSCSLKRSPKGPEAAG
jgi:hypothetical protein